eukprot:scaffold204156_cov17-Tisochrysis_lutea.AAC.1
MTRYPTPTIESPDGTGFALAQMPASNNIHHTCTVPCRIGKDVPGAAPAPVQKLAPPAMAT